MVQSASATQLLPFVRKRAAIYVRVSTDRQEEEGTSLISQEQRALEYCRNQRYEVDEQHIYREVYTGAEYRGRPKLNLMRTAARNHEFDVVVVFAFDRLARNQVHQAVIIDDLEHNGVTLESITENFDDSALGQFMRSTYAFLAELEREKIVERLERGKLTRVQEGKLLGNWQPLYGYSFNEERTGYVFNDTVIKVDATGFAWTEVKVARRVFREVAQGSSIRRVAIRLTQDGIPTRKGFVIWRPAMLHTMLTNRFYIGEVWVYKKERAYAYSGVRISRPQEEQIKMPDGVVPPMIDTETFAIVQEQLQRNKVQSARNNKHPQDGLLRCGLVKCGYCGKNMTVLRRHRKIGEKYYDYVSYQCCKGVQGLGECQRVVIVTHFVDDAAWEHAVEIINDPSLVAQKLEQKRKKYPLERELVTVDKRLKEIDAEVQNLIYMGQHAQSKESLESLGKLLGHLEQEKNQWLKEQRKLQNIDEEYRKEQEALALFAKRCEAMRASLADPMFEPSYEFKREALEYFGIKALVWRPERNPRFQITCDPPSIVSRPS